MKPRFSKKRNSGMTLFEVGVVIAVVMLLALVLLSTFLGDKPKIQRINCVSNLNQVCLAFRIWEGDNGDIYPMGVSVTNGGSLELVATGNVLATFLIMSNQLSTPKILHCPLDTGTNSSTWTGLASFNISYFVGVDATNEANPQMMLSGDDNFEISGVPLKSDLLEVPTNTPISWTAARHKFAGNIGLCDDSVQQVNRDGLQKLLQQTGVATNRLAIP
jgi:type II secretory pathway pseudopilin PulG